jgi:hypothetical protein
LLDDFPQHCPELAERNSTRERMFANHIYVPSSLDAGASLASWQKGFVCET